ncbi:MAG: response regulator [Microbacterium sp.]|jgi:response regulator of citrate/malate metabolism|uniref:response regulator n=1 Tax=Microbacterium sp. TaxID=51671 RepID=UPI0025EC9E50|nr:response regulator [Microbacterium sp.]MBQ9916151.1 response regulator [Microbacterium sp.]
MTDRIRVLVVDDDAAARALHGRYVAEVPGFAVVGSAADGAGAIASAQAGVDLVLLDMRLPDISGVEVLHRLRTLGAGAVDVLVISSSQDQVTVRQALAAHVVGYLVKPFTADTLRRRLEAYRVERSERADADRDRALSQGDIDRLLGTGTVRVPTRTAPEARPKGLASVTLERVRAALDPVAFVSAAEVATACGLSRATAQRYLEHLVATGVIDLAHRYGARGRPRILYRLAPAPPE